MAITISGQNNNDKILASDGVLDSISGFNVVGVMTAAQFDVTGKTTTNHISIGNNIHLGNAGIITATTLLGNVTGNINHTSNLLLQISGSEKFRVGNGGQFGIAGANYGTAGQVFTSGGSGSAPTWSTIASDKITEGNTEAEVVDTGSDGHFKVTTEGSERVRIDSTGRVLIGTTTEGYTSGDNLTVADSGHAGITIRSGTSSGGNIYFSDGTSGADEYRGAVSYDHANNFLRFYANATERVRIDSSGRLLVGDANATGAAIVQVQKTSGDMVLVRNHATNYESLILSVASGTADIYASSGGSTSRPDLRFITNDGERLRITSTGRVGINETSPDTYFHVKTGVDSALVKLENSASSGRSQVQYLNPHGDWVQGIIGGTTDGDFITYTSAAKNIRFYTNNTERLRIDTGGRLLVANTTGSTTNVSNNADDIVIGNTSTSNETGISMFSTNASGIRFNDASGTDAAIEYAHSARELRFNSAGANRLQFGINASNSPVFSLGTGHYSGDSNNHNQGDRTSVKVGAYLHLESANGAGHNSRAGLGYNCYFSSAENFNCGTRSPSGGDNRPAAYGIAYGNHYFYSDASNTAHSAQASLTMTKNMVIHRQGYVTKPLQPSFRAHDSNHAQNGFLTFDQIATNVGSHYNGSNGRFTAPVAGTYFFSFYGMLSNASQNGRVEYYINGSVHSSGEHYGGVAYTNGQTYNMITCNTVLTLSQNDYVNLHWNTSYNSMHSYHNGFMGFLIG